MSLWAALPFPGMLGIPRGAPPRYLACINFIGVQLDTNTHGSVSAGRGFWPFSDQAWWSRFGYMLYILVISIRLQKRKKKTLMKIRGVYGPELWHFNVGVTVVTAHTCHNSGHPSLSQSRIWVCVQIWYFSLFEKENEEMRRKKREMGKAKVGDSDRSIFPINHLHCTLLHTAQSTCTWHMHMHMAHGTNAHYYTHSMTVVSPLSAPSRWQYLHPQRSLLVHLEA